MKDKKGKKQRKKSLTTDQTLKKEDNHATKERPFFPKGREVKGKILKQK